MATILVVVDDPFARDYLARLLGFQGHRVIVAADGREGLEQAGRESPDLVISDLVVQGMDGFELAASLRQLPEARDVPLIFLTATYHQHEARSLAERLGADTILEKPAEPEKVLATVAQALQRRAPAPKLEEFAHRHARLLGDTLVETAAEAQDTAEKLRQIAGITHELATEIDPQRLLSRFCAEARSLIGARYSAVGLFEHHGEGFSRFESSGFDEETRARLGGPPRLRGVLGDLARRTTPLRIPDVAAHPEAKGFPSHHPPIRSLLSAPLVAKGHRHGVLYLGDRIGRDAFTEEDERLTVVIAAALAAALENARLYGDLAARARQQGAVARVGQLALESPDLDGLLDQAVRIVSDTLDVELCGILELDPGGPRLLLRAGVGWRNGLVGRTYVPAERDSQAGYTLQSNGAVVVHDFADETRFRAPRLFEEHGVVGGASVTIGTPDRPFGVLGVHTRRLRRLSTHDVHFLEATASTLGTAIERHRLAEAPRMLLSLSDAALSTLEWHELLGELLGRIRLLAGGDAVTILLATADATELEVSASVGDGTTKRTTRIRIGDAVPGRVAATRESEIVMELTPAEAAAGACDERARSLLAVPLLIHDRLLGVLQVESRQARWFNRDQLGLLRLAADRVAWAVDRSRLFEAERQLRQELEQRVEERTAELREINAELESFSYSVSHDLRAPLRALQGLSQALVEDYGEELDETARDYLGRLVESSERLDRLIQDLLAYSRIGRTAAEVGPVSLDEIVDRALAQSDTDARERHAEVDVERPLGTVRGHEASLVQAVANLVSNALKFVEPGRTPRVRISSRARDGRTRLCIEDNGIGIAAENQERIFKVFERLHGIESYAGTGIGLAIVRKAVERLGGHVGVESEPGKGSRFWIELPEEEVPAA